MGRPTGGTMQDMQTPQQLSRTMFVLALDDEFSGALAYALNAALFEPARIQVLRVGRHAPLGSSRFVPVPVQDLSTEEAAALLRERPSSDVLVVEGLARNRASARLLEDLRDHPRCLVVEVDDRAEVIAAAGPGGWSYSAA
jgi:hypothetical protein